MCPEGLIGNTFGIVKVVAKGPLFCHRGQISVRGCVAHVNVRLLIENPTATFGGGHREILILFLRRGSSMILTHLLEYHEPTRGDDRVYLSAIHLHRRAVVAHVVSSVDCSVTIENLAPTAIR
jgi:hypothetical protein